jgi:hypothetical protein
MQAIVSFDCEPSVFQVHVIKASYMTGFTVEVEFRDTMPDAISSFETTDENLNLALEKAYWKLQDWFGKCPTCGQHRHRSRTAKESESEK